MTKGLTQGVNGRGVGSFWIGRGGEGQEEKEWRIKSLSCSVFCVTELKEY